jgi:hypothetical protein
MAIKFATSSLSSSSSNLYKIDKFNGVDYTTTPVSVDDTRAIDMSNYLPQGNALIKRNGFHMQSQVVIENDTYTLLNIWNFKPKSSEKTNEYDYYIGFAAKKSIGEVYSKFKLFLLILPRGSEIKIDNPTVLKSFENSTDYAGAYSYGAQFENRLFLLLQNSYLMIWEEEGQILIDDVKAHAYIPTLVTGIGAKQIYRANSSSTGFGASSYSSQLKSAFLEQSNLLTNAVKLELVIDAFVSDGINDICVSHYDIGQFLFKDITIKKLKINNVEYSGKNTEVYFGEYKSEFTLWHYSDSSKGESPVHFLNGDKTCEDHYMLTMLLYANSSNDIEPFFTIEVEYEYDDGTDPSKMVEHMRFGMPYGSNGYRDRLFMSGNPEHPSIDIKSCNASFSENNWQDYAYFGSDEYRSLGSGDTAIIGYGVLNNGNMAILKQDNNGQPNLFFRNFSFATDSDGNTIETYPVVSGGVSLEIDYNSKMVTYGNDLLVTTKNGLYKIVAGTSTASQVYEANEMSYFIRNNINDDLTASDIVVYKNLLLWNKQDSTGKTRVYVADKNKYGVVEGTQTYEWWALDGLDVIKFFVLKGSLYYSNDIGLFKLSDDYVDKYNDYIKDVTVNNQSVSSTVFIDTNNDYIIISEGYHSFTEILESDDIKAAYEDFKLHNEISFNNEIVIHTNIPDSNTEITASSESSYYDYHISCTLEEGETVCRLLNEAYSDGSLLLKKSNVAYNVYGEIETTYTSDDRVDIYCKLKGIETDYPTKDVVAFVAKPDTRFKIKELYTENGYPLSLCEYKDGKVYYYGPDEDEPLDLGREKHVYFNRIELMYSGCGAFFEEQALSETVVKGVTIYTEKPVESYWRSKYISFGREDYLKTIDLVTFVAESRLGGNTNVGYRSYKSDSSFSAETNRGEIDFSYFDFNRTMSADKFAMTHTSKKKIKNFSYIQLFMTSSEKKNSTATSISLRYRVTRNNKGVK